MVYEGTPGLLISNMNPKEYTYDDLMNYKEILYNTNALHQHYDPNSRYPRASRSKKWKNLLSSIWNDLQMSNEYEDSDDDDVFEDSHIDPSDTKLL